MDSEIPCRDTDPIENTNMAVKGETLAFTIDFGDSDDFEDKAKKFERFAQRSSQRRVNSPRMEKNTIEETNIENPKQSEEIPRAKVLTREKSNLSTVLGSHLKVTEQRGYRSEARQKIGNKEKEQQEVDDEVNSNPGTYTMDEDEDLEKVSALMDKTKYVEEWTAKHSQIPSPDASSLSRRRLPAAPGAPSPDSASEAGSYDDSKDLLNNTDVNNKTNIRPFDRFRNLSMPKRNTTGLVQSSNRTELIMKTNARDKDCKRNELIKRSLLMSSAGSGSGSAPNSARSGSSESSGYSSRQALERLSARRKEASPTTQSKTPSRSSSSLTSHEADFQAWKRRKEYKPFSSSTRPSQNQRSGYSQRQTSPNPPCKPPLIMTQSLKMNSKQLTMQRANSFHQDNLCQASMSTVHEKANSIEVEEAVTYRTSDDYYLDEDELILPLYPSEKPFHSKPVRTSKAPNKLEALDNLVISTTHNASSKLCRTAAQIIRKAAKLVPEEDEDTALTMETVTYLLEDMHMPSSYRTKTSLELAGTLKNLKKLEQALGILNKVFDIEEE